MKNELIPSQKQSALAVMASKFNVEPAKLLETLRATLMPKATNEEMLSFVVVANQYGLNPFTREIYAFPARNGGIQPVVSVDGWIKMMNSHSQFDGIEFKTEDKDGKPYSVTLQSTTKSGRIRWRSQSSSASATAQRSRGKSTLAGCCATKL